MIQSLCKGHYDNYGKGCPTCGRFMDDCDGAVGFYMDDDDKWSEEEEASSNIPKCLFCNNLVAPIPGCSKRLNKVCKEHTKIKCPECGHDAFWINNRKHKSPGYVCFAVEPWCDWTSRN